mmetsp:Transcript_41412/g.72727  ORF Transcript_41412/g.72727 Transcript_41412/m.72727 type:complete len:330 (-) Transcript_41412:86-1075(-)
MGCGASVDRAVNAEEMENLCAACAKEMMYMCLGPALENSASIKVPAPGEVQTLKQNVADLKAAAEKLRTKEEKTEAPKAEAKEEPKDVAGKAMAFASGMVSAAAGAAKTGADAVAGAAAGVTAKGIDLMAESLQQLVTAIESPFESVGSDIVQAKKDKIDQVFRYQAGNVALKQQGDAVLVVRGEAPYDQIKYDAVKPNAVTEKLVDKCAKNLSAQMLTDCAEEIKNHAVTKVWQGSIDKYNDLSSQVAAIDFLSTTCGIKLVKIEFNLPEHIVNSIIDQLAGLMADQEKELRKESVGKSKNYPEAFPIVFSGVPLTLKTYKMVFPDAQ